MTEVLLAFIEWGKVHWWFFGWTVFWSLLLTVAMVLSIIRSFFCFLPNRILRSRNLKHNGWPPSHLDGDGDFRPLEEKKE